MRLCRIFAPLMAASLLFLAGCGGTNSKPISLTYNVAAPTYTKGTAITPNFPIAVNASFAFYFVSPALPAGLAMGPTTGIITGTPTVVTATANYVVTGTGIGISATTTLVITVIDAAPLPDLAYTRATSIYTVGTAITANTPTNTGGALVAYAVSPALPAGLALNPTTGVITGTPTTVTAVASYVVTASNTSGAATARATLNMTVVAAPVATSLVAATNPVLYGGSTSLTPTFSGGTGAVDQGIGAVTSGTAFSSGALTAAKTFTLTVTNAAGVTATAAVGVTLQSAGVAAISPAAPTLTVSTGTTFSSSVSGASNTGLTWSATAGTINSSTGAFTAPASPGSVTITATSQADGTKTASTTVTVVAAPTIASFAPAAATLTAGASTTLTATFAGGTGSINQGVGAVTSTMAKTVTPASTTTYTLTVTNAATVPAAASLTATTSVTVVAAPVATSLVAGTNPVLYGGSTSLTPTFSGGTGAVDQGIGVVTSGTTFSSGALTAAKTFTLTVTNAAGATATAAVGVTLQSAGVAAISPAAPTLTVSTGTTFSSSVSGASNTGLTWSAIAGTINASTGAFTAPASPGSVTITATSQADATKTATTTVTVVAAPVATSLVAGTNPVLYGGSTNLTPTFSGGTGAVDQGIGAVTSGTAFSSGALTAAKTFTLTVTNAAGATATAAVGVTLQSAGVAAISPAAPTLTVSTGTTFSSSVSGASNTGLTWSAIAGTINASTGAFTAPASPGSVTITATSQADATKTATTTVTVVAAPVATSLVAGTNPVLYGGSTNLTPTFSGGTGAVDQGIGAVTSGTAFSSGALAGATTFTLTVTNATSATATTSVVMTVQTPSVSAVSPATVTLAVGATQTFSATVSYTVNSAISWSVDSIAGGNASVGTITSGGVYTAGTTAGAHTIKATAAADGTTYSTATATVSAVPTNLTYSTSPAVYTKGAAITANTPSNSGGAVVSYAISANLPTGLSFSTTTGVISGTPTAITSSASFTITATNANGNCQVSLSITVNDAIPTSLTYSTSPAVYTKGVVIDANNPSHGGGTVVSYSISPVLPTGLSFSTTTGVINGTPTVIASSASYTITATNTGGSATKSLTLTVNDAIPTSLTYGTSPAVYTKDVAIAPNTPGNSGGVVTSYSVSPSLPAGLALDVTTGVISGTPTAVSAAGSYVITASNTGGSTPVTLSITVVAAPTTPVVTTPAYVTASQMGYTASVSTQSNCTYAWTISGGTITAGATTTSITFTAGASGTVTPSCIVTNQANTASTAGTANSAIVAVPTPSSFSASSIAPAYGATFTLTPTYTGGTGTITASAGPSITCPDSGLTSSAITANWFGTRTYTLTVTNAAGTFDSSQEVGVIPHVASMSAISPAAPTLNVGASQTFTSTVTGGSANTVTWSSGGAGTGTWSTNTWTAPNTPGSYTITATSTEDGTTHATTTATVVAVISGNLSGTGAAVSPTLRSPKGDGPEEALSGPAPPTPSAALGAGITVNLIQINSSGVQQGGVLATATTDASGNYSLSAPANFVFGPSYVVRAVVPTTIVTISNFVTGATANIDPYTQASVALITGSGANLSTLGSTNVLAIQGTVYSNMGNVPSSATATADVLTALTTAMTKDDEANNTVVNLASSTYITGHVYSGAGTGTPLAGIGVKVCTYSGLVLMGVTHTDALGYFKVNVPPGDYVVGAMNTTTTSFAASGWWTTGGVAVLSQFKAGKVTVPSSGLATSDFHLIEGGRLRGTLTGNTGGTIVSLPGMTVAISDFGSGQTLMSADTGPNGIFVFNVPAGTYSASVRNKTRYVPYGSANKMDTPPAGTGGGRNITQASKITVAAGAELAGDMMLYLGFLISGQVKTGPTGTAVVGMPVRFQDSNATQTINGVVGPGGSGAGAESVRTDIDGNYRLWVQPGHYHILSRGQMLSNQDASSANLSNMDFITAMGKLSMKLVDSVGNPLSQVRGDLYDSSGSNGLSQEISNSEGTLEMFVNQSTNANVKLGFSVYTGEFFGSSVYSTDGAVASAAIRDAYSISSPTADTTSYLGVGTAPNTTITLPDGATLSGYVTTNPGSGSPVGWPNALVQVRMGDDVDGTYKLVNVRTKSDGFYTVTLPAGLTIYKLRAFPPTSSNPAWGSSGISNVTMGVKGTNLSPQIKFNWIFGAALVPDSSHVASGSTTLLTPTFASGTAKIGTSPDTSFVHDPGVDTVSSGSKYFTGNINATTTFTLTITDANGGKSYYSCTVNVP